MSSILYLFSAVLLITVFMIYPKGSNKQPFIQWIAIGLFGYELFACSVGAILSILYIPADIISVACVNLLTAIALLLSLVKKKYLQKYTVNRWNILGVGIIAALILAAGLYRFEGFTVLNYETSDPGVHMRMAMDCINYRNVNSDFGSMIFSQFTNALWIEMLMPIFSGAYTFKSFIIKDVYNLLLAGLLFYAAFRPEDEKQPRWQILLITIAYLAGYPLSNLLFGFQYLGLGVTALCFLALCSKLYVSEGVSRKWIVFLMNLGCIGSSLSYTLFAPVVYIALFLFLSYEFFKDRDMKVNGTAIKEFIKLQLSVFLLPTLLTIYYIVFVQLLSSANWDEGLGTAMSYEGYIYRNLYSDFTVILPFALYGWWTNVKERKLDPLTFLLPIEILYCAVFFIKMLNGEVSTYYFYKLNYLNALLLYGLGAAGIIRICKLATAMVNTYLITWILIFATWNSGFVVGLAQQNANFAPFYDEAAAFHIYETNKFYLSRNTSNQDWIILSDAVVRFRGEDERTNLFVGDWMSSYWYEALADEKIKPNYAHSIGANQVMDLFATDQTYGDYLVVIADSAEALSVKHLLEQYEVVFWCDSGYIIKR